MKTLVFVFLLIGFLFVAGCTGGQPKQSKQKVENKSGKIVIVDENESELTVSPFCVVFDKIKINYSGAVYEDKCLDSTTLLRYTCDGRKLKNETISCGQSNICSNGLCTSASSQQSTQPSRAPIAPTNLSACRDTDGGYKPETPGQVEFAGKIYSDACNAVFDLTEYYCEDNLVKQKAVYCGAGNKCQNGACVEPVRTCTDTNSSEPEVFGISVQYGGGVVIQTYQDVCIDQLTKKSYYCEEGVVRNKTERCPSGSYCQGGGCTANCQDSDGGHSYYVVGRTIVGLNTSDDYCKSNSVLVEYYCQNNTKLFEEYDCNGPCYEGRCLKPNELTCRQVGDGRSASLFLGTQIVYEKNSSCMDFKSRKAYFCGSGRISEDIQRCTNSQVCQNGLCERITEARCYDFRWVTDSYYRPHVIITTKESISNVLEDTCNSEKEAINYYCDGSTYTTRTIKCSEGEKCVKGACVRQ